jgi:hypothetical protein
MNKRITPKDLDKIFTDDILANLPNNKNIKKGVANRRKAEDPRWKKSMETVQASKEYKEKVSKTSKEKWQDPTFRNKRQKSLDPWAKSDERREQVKQQMSGKKKSASHKKNMSQSQKDFYKTPEGKKALASKSSKQKGQKRPIVICPHCGKTGADRIMGRWHFDNCKHRKQS